jgi:hypothetical protein
LRNKDVKCALKEFLKNPCKKFNLIWIYNHIFFNLKIFFPSFF